MWALELRAERTTARAGSPPPAMLASHSGTRRGLPTPERLCGEGDEVVLGDRLVVGDVIDGAVRGALGGVDAGGGDILDPDHVPPVRPGADHDEPARARAGA